MQRGWALFFAGLGFSLFVGGAIRLFLHPGRVQAFINPFIEKNSSEYLLTYQEAGMILSDGLWPRLGVRLSGVTVKARNECKTRSTLSVGELYAPLRLSDLWRGRLRFGWIQARDVSLSLKASLCNAPVEGAASFSAIPLAELQDYFSHRFGRDLKKSHGWHRGWTVTHMEVKADEFNVVFDELKFDFSDSRTFWLAGEMSVHVPLSGRTLKSPFEFDIKMKPDKMTGTLRGNAEEGLLSVGADVNVPKGTLALKSELRHLPGRLMFEFLKSRNIIEIGLKPQRWWLGCQLAWKTSLTTWTQDPFSVSDCAFEGEMGRISAPRMKLSLKPPYVSEPFTVNLERIPLDEWHPATGEEVVSRYIADWGTLFGGVEVRSAEDIAFKGHLENLRLRFYRNKISQIQILSNVIFQLKKVRDQWDFSTESVQFKDGSFEGSLRGRYRARDGLYGQLKFTSLILSSNIMNLVGVEDLRWRSFDGEFTWKEGVSEWNANGDVERWVLGPLTASDLIFGVKGSDFQNWDGQGRIASLNLKSGSISHDRIWPLTLDGRFRDRDLVAERGRLKIARDGADWKWREVRWDMGALNFSSQGALKNGVFQEAVIQARRSKGVPFSWDLLGPWGDFVLLPSKESLSAPGDGESRLTYLRQQLEGAIRDESGKAGESSQ